MVANPEREQVISHIKEKLSMGMHRKLWIVKKDFFKPYIGTYFFSLDLIHVHNSWNNSPATNVNIHYNIIINIIMFNNLSLIPDCLPP